VIELDTNAIHYKELIVTGTTANTTEDCRRALELVLGGSIDTATLVSRSYRLAEADKALEAAGSGEALKVVIEP
jgi:L-iditol 2-dehydrogenase